MKVTPARAEHSINREVCRHALNVDRMFCNLLHVDFMLYEPVAEKLLLLKPPQIHYHVLELENGNHM